MRLAHWLAGLGASALRHGRAVPCEASYGFGARQAWLGAIRFLPAGARSDLISPVSRRARWRALLTRR